ncbi:amidohydrolase family protein [Cloacibacillus porcorum]|uniref:amidohydrolase family protein n=2 Tax=Cloacibacillus porcorum TaxID=1197717 RepID=UPI002A81A9FF|nr:amidohydrolase family protein [Cloacibacillus porcorum]MDD7648017.1 amidohydrolase family protein [Cloacibacillus porcorum]MDY4094582.1 amidohydrolase family protein [Cloacibacillus porcorum]
MPKVKNSDIVSLMIIDFHTHVFPYKMADAAMTKLQQQCEVPYYAPATVGSLIRTMDECGVDKSVVLNIVTKETQHEHVLSFAKEIDSERLISFGSVMPGSEYALEYVWKISDEGLKGIKLHPPLQRADVDDKRLFPVYDLARALNLVVVFHAGWDATYRDEMRASVEMTINVVKNFPGLKLVAAHMGGLRLARDVFDHLAGKYDLYFDTAYAADPWLDKDMFRDIIRRHGAERILFGSDYPWHLPSMEIGLINSLDIGEEEKKMILGENAARLLGL